LYDNNKNNDNISAAIHNLCRDNDNINCYEQLSNSNSLTNDEINELNFSSIKHIKNINLYNTDTIMENNCINDDYLINTI